VELEFPAIVFDPGGSQASTTPRVNWNSVPSTQMRCMITANRRASAAIAFFIPRCLAIFTRIISSPHLDIAPVLLISPD